MAQEVPSLFRDDDASSAARAAETPAAATADHEASDAAKEARLLSLLLLHFSVKRDHPALRQPRHHGATSHGSAEATTPDERFPYGMPLISSNASVEAGAAPVDANIHPATDVAIASSLLRSQPSERELIQQYLLLPQASRNKVAQSLFVIPPSLIDDFASVMQFFLRVLLEAHSDSRHHEHTDDSNRGQITHEKLCSWARNSDASCVSYEQDEASAGSPAPRQLAVFTLPPGLQACLNKVYGSVQRTKCEEVWHGDHMAYRCRTCGLSDSSCMCLACFDPSDHEGHDYRVYRCSSGGCCDCGDPLAWKPEGFCKKHRKREVSPAEIAEAPSMGPVELAVVRGLVSRVIAFCIHVMREVYTFCLRPGAATSSVFDGLFSSTATRLLPKTGRRRSSFPSVLQVHLDRMQQCFAWLQALATSCVPYREIVTEMFLDSLPPEFQLDPSTDQVPTGPQTRVTLDVFLKCGVLLPVDMCDTLGVLYLKLLFDQVFKQKYTCHFVDWYPYFIELYLMSSDENNEDGMRSLSRFIDRLFCQLFHSIAQLQELERAFIDRSKTQDEAPDHTHVPVVERLLVLLFDKLIGLFKSTLRVETARDTGGLNSPATSVQVVDCGRNVFKKRVYARLCSDIRTLLVHPSVAGQVIRESFTTASDEWRLRDGKTVYSLLIEAFETLQQMDLQERHVQQHIEFESQNWTFAFVVDYEMNLLLAAFLAGLPFCFEPEPTDKWQVACALVTPLRAALQRWTASNSTLSSASQVATVIETTPVKRSFHLPLHHMFAAVFQGVSAIVRPESTSEWQRLLFARHSGELSRDETAFLLGVVDHPLRTGLLAREIKAGLWVRNGNVMWQQLVHYYAKHWRFFGLYSDLFVCQLGVLLLPPGEIARVMMGPQLTVADTLETAARQQVQLLEEMLRFVSQLVLSPIECFPCASITASPEAIATWRVEREVMHWLSLGPFGRSDVVAHLDMKLVEQVRLMPSHEWYLLEEEEIVTHVLERVAEYDDPSGPLSFGASDTPNSGGPIAFGMKMTGTWQLKSELWRQISPLFECFSPAEAQQCEQNVKKHHLRQRSTVEDGLLRVPQPGDCNQQSARALAQQLLDSPEALATIAAVLKHWCTRESTHAKADSEHRTVGESVVVAALQALFIAVSLLESHEVQEQADDGDEEQREIDGQASKLAVKLQGRRGFFTKLCCESDSTSLLSLLSSLNSSQSGLSPDSKALAQAIVETATHKAVVCREYMALKADSNPSLSSATESTDAEEKQRLAKELMRRRQREVMERMRKQQLQFLSSQSITSSEVSGDEDARATGTDDAELATPVDRGQSRDQQGLALEDEDDDAEDEDDAYLSTEYEDDDDDDEDDEWGFPTGLINLELYQSHVSSAISVVCDRERRALQRQYRRQRRRTRTSIHSDAEADRPLVTRRSSSLELADDESVATEEECALCRLPCDPHNVESTFGYVAMIQPTSLPHKLGLSSASSQLPPFPRSSRYSTADDVPTQPSCDSIVWTCGHAIHHTCIKGYIDSLWKNHRSQRNPFDGLHNHGDDRLLSERDLEFQCPVCRRLSNCLLPALHTVLQPPVGSTRSITGDDDDIDDSVKQNSITRWLQAQMMARIEARQTTEKTAPVHEAMQSRLHKFCLQLKHRSVRTSLQLPLLLAGGLDDELVIDAELRHISELWSAQFTNWQLLHRCLEVALDLTIREKMAMGTAIHESHIDRPRMQSLRLLSELSVVATVAEDANIHDGGLPRLQSIAATTSDVLFGRRVLFADDDDDQDHQCSPVLAHPHLFSVFSSRLTALLGDKAANDRYSEELLTDVLYTARVVVTAQLLQALCSVAVAPPPSRPSDVSSPPRSPVKAARGARFISDFSSVETLGDAMQWAHQLMARCRLAPSSQPLQRSSTRIVEAFVVDKLLPLLQRIVLLIQVALPRMLHEDGDETCGLCEELANANLHPPRPASKPRDQLNALLRRLHLPPLRLFFSRVVFSPSERELCQLWAAQMETKAAVLRRQASTVVATQLVPSLSGLLQRRLIIDLPKTYMDFFIKYNDKPQGLCKRCHQLPQHPAICLFCGDVLCCFSSCCESPHGRRIGECTQHAQQCGLGMGAFLLLRACTVILFLGNERRCVWGSLYVDKNGEEDPYLRRGRTLFLAANRLLALESLLLSHSFTQNTSILSSTSRRDGRRY